MAPKRLESCVSQVEETGKSKSSAFAICTASLKKSDSKKKSKGKKDVLP